MSSDEERSSKLYDSHKKRKILRACDTCRKRKIRCDGMEDATKQCTHCRLNNYECLYNDTVRRRTPSKRYVETLEKRIAQIEKLLQTVRPELDTPEDPGSDPSTPRSKAVSPLLINHDNECLNTAIKILHNPQTPPGCENDDSEHMHIDTDEIEWRQRAEEPPLYHFVGKSSHAMLVKKALDTKEDYYKQYMHTTGETVTEPLWKAQGIQGFMSSFRREFWMSRPWESKLLQSFAPKKYKFPDEDLLWSLIELYFEHINLILPLLHRPTFEKAVKDKVHYRNNSFACLLLVLCALASRWSNDPRVFLDPTDTNSSGWAWFQQVEIERGSIISPPRSLYDLQFYCICCQYLYGSSLCDLSWTIVGLGLRLAQELGIHRRKVTTSPWSVEDELWKRAFWVLVVSDRMICTILGRPCAIQDEDFDVDMPLECDDEYWNSNPDYPFIQPPKKPSTVTAFNLYINIAHLHGFVLRSIYALNKPKVILGSQWHEWEERIVMELDSALNKFLDSIPAFLRWDPEKVNADPTLAKLSCFIYTAFYQLQILVHRPFIANKKSPLSGPSLSICTSAARSCSRMVEILTRDDKMEPFLQGPAFTSAIILLLSKWSRKKASESDGKDMEDVQMCLSSLEHCGTRWIFAGKLYDILKDISSLGEFLTQPSTYEGPGLRWKPKPQLPDADEGLLLLAPTDENTTNFWYSSMESNGLPPYLAEEPVNVGGGLSELGDYDNTISDVFPNVDSQELDMDNNALAMWSLMPNGIEFDNWNTYFNDMTQGAYGDPIN